MRRATTTRLGLEEVQRFSSFPLELFYQGIRAEETKKSHERKLRNILCVVLEDVLHGSLAERALQMVRMGSENPEGLTDLLLSLSSKLRKRTELPKNNPDYLNPASFRNYFDPVKKLMDMNNIQLPWRRIKATFPELDNISEGRGWEKSEIQKMLEFARGPTDKAIILIASSSGIRKGGFEFNWEDIVPVYQIDGRLAVDISETDYDKAEVACAMIRIYKGSSCAYAAFITPEAYAALLNHKRKWIREVGRPPKPDEPVFKQRGTRPIRLKSTGIKDRVIMTARLAGLKEPLSDGQRYPEVPVMNGFRRFWCKTVKGVVSKDSPLSSLIKKERMMGHTGLVKLDRNYFKTSALELAEEYVTVVSSLTISDEFRLRAENLVLRQKREEELSFLKEKVAQQNYEILKMQRQLEQLKNNFRSSD